jgi:transposase
MPKQPTWVGIDVAQKEVVVALYPSQETWSVTCTNKALHKLANRLVALHPKGVILEATGGYERPIVQLLMKWKLPVSVVNPRSIRDYAKSQGILAKTDKLDARIIAQFGAKCDDLRLTALPNVSEQELKDFVARRQQLTEMLTMEKNRFQQAPQKLRSDIQAHIDWLEERLKDIDRKMTKAIHLSSELQTTEKLLRTVPGVGPVIARTFMALVPELGNIDRKQVAALIGVAPLNHDSGKFKGQRKIWGGRAAVRQVLYMGALAAIRTPNPFSEMYKRLRSTGKLAKVALVAVMRKLLTVLNAMLREQLSWKELKIYSSSS